MSTPTAADAATENFADLLAESFAENTAIEGSVVKGTVVGVSDDYVTIDVGLKSEGRVPPNADYYAHGCSLHRTGPPE